MDDGEYAAPMARGQSIESAIIIIKMSIIGIRVNIVITRSKPPGA
jgi:hypothetical protein